MEIHGKEISGKWVLRNNFEKLSIAASLSSLISNNCTTAATGTQRSLDYTLSLSHFVGQDAFNFGVVRWMESKGSCHLFILKLSTRENCASISYTYRNDLKDLRHV
jgi:hypothetical protein